MSDIVLLAHRGSNPYPDHTVEAYSWAVNWGADFIEPDLYLTKDGVLVASHDDHNYANLTYAEAKAIEPALMTFGEVIELAKAMSVETGRAIGIVPETKNTSYATSEAVIKVLVEHGFTDPDLVVIQSFSPTNLQQLHDTIMPQYGVDIPLAYLRSGIGDPVAIATFADMVAPAVNSFTAADVAAAHAAGLKVVTWTILGAKADVQKYVDMGVDAIFVDDTKLARESIAEIAGAKAVFGSTQWDVVNGSEGADVIYAISGDDILRAGDGNDVLYGDAGNDLLFGGAGDDRLIGGSGNDYLAGGSGSDVLSGGAGNDVIVATGDQVVFRAGDGIDLVSLDSTSTILFDGITPVSVSVIRDGSNLIIRSGSDAIVLLNGVDAAHRPASITTADGFTLSGAELAALAVDGSDTEVAALLPGLEDVLATAPAFATPSTIALGTDLVAEGDFEGGVLSQRIEDAETGATYRLSFSLSDLPTGDDGVRVTWGGQVLFEGVPSGAGSDLHFIVKGGAGDGSNQLIFEGMGTGFGAALDDVHLVKLADAVLPVPGNAAPEADDDALVISQGFSYRGQVAATDANGDMLTYSLLDGPAHGALVLNADGNYRYVPEAGFAGADAFSVLVNDGRGGVIETSVNFNVVPGIVIGTDLVANGSFEDISASTGNNGPSDWGYRNPNGIIAGWTDVNGNRIEQHWDSPNGVVAKDGRMWLDMDGYNTNTHIVQQVGRVEAGATYVLSFSLGDADTALSNDGIRVVWNGQLVYEGIPTNPWQTLSFRVTGGSGDGSNKLEFIATGTGLNTYGAALDDVRLVKLTEPGTAPEQNTAPDALDGTASGTRGKPIDGQLAATDADGDVSLTYALATGPSHGTVEIDADGSYRYTPAAGYIGQDSFTFTVSDGYGGTDTAMLSLTIAPSTAVGPELIVNGGFEDLTGADDAASWGYRNTNPAGVIAGWVNTGDTRAEVHRDTVGGIGAVEGTYWFDMEGAPKNARLVQTVAGVTEGETYRLSFAIADTDTAQASDTITVYWGGQIIYTGIPKNKWQEITIDVVGGAGDGSNKLEFASTTVSPNGAGVALDKVSMVWIDQSPNLIVNGSFEDLTGANNGNWSGDWGYRNDSGVIAGWTQTNTAAGGRAELHFDTQNGVSAKDGKVWFDMDGNGNNARLVQKVAGVEAGATYRLSFFIADADARTTDDGIRVYWGGQLVYEGVPTNSWQAITVDVVGGTGDGTNELIFQGTEANLNGYGAALDDISLRKIADAPPPNAAPVAGHDSGFGTAYGAVLAIDPATLLANDSDANGDALTILSVAALSGGTVLLDAQGKVVFTPAAGFSGEA
ncbi:MAG TPA: Ig-like domain-containing protein, partial [Bosea sp. (in: a-proteobacteria)]|uniref:Ig-like domain-containing protein n=1 Tax=Bosea sp. (in: a-proteobacteria) TaxID=1871050 RepID=UPI002E1269B5|nr:Ig-like domain-containing protein [Bosea sp. (in: a-proteobacteria)]